MFGRVISADPQAFWKQARKILILDWFYRVSNITMIGRAQRKTLHLIIHVLSKALNAARWAFARLPFVVSASLPEGAGTEYFTRKNSPGTLFLKYLMHLEYITARFEYQPKFSVILPVYKVDPKYLREAINSVCYQAYQNWELCVVDDCSDNVGIDALLAHYQKKLGPTKFKHKKHEKNLHISQTSNNAVEMATGDYLLFLDHDDRLTPNALAEVVRFININHSPDILYSDERTVGENGEQSSPAFYKPNFSRYLLYSVNYICHLLIMRRTLFKSVGGFRAGYEGAQDHDLVLRAIEKTRLPIIHIPMCLYEWRAIPQSTASGLSAKSYALDAGVKAVSDALKRLNRPAAVTVDPATNHYRIQYTQPEELPLISILIPSKDAPSILKKCIDSIFSKTTWQNFEVVLLDNDTRDLESLELIQYYVDRHGDKFRTIKCPGPFNFNAFNNIGAKAARGEYLVLLNNDTEIVAPNWLAELWGLAQWPEVGAVGARLLYEDCTIQHSGVLLFSKQIAGHSCMGWDQSSLKYCGMSATPHDASAVTAACLMIKKEKYIEIEGLDELIIPNGWGDVDFCLRLRKKGYLNLYTPYATLFHYESKSRGISYERFEMLEMIRRHGAALIQDPFLNPNLCLNGDYERDGIYSVCDPDAVVMKTLLDRTNVSMGS